MWKSGDKKFKDWPRLKGSQVLIQTLQTFLSEKVLSHTNSNSDLTLEKTEAQICASVIPPCISINNGNKTDVEQLISGTYAHPLLIPSIAGWISPEFQIKANRVVNEYILREYKRELQDVKVQLEITAGNVAKLEEVVAEKDELINGKGNLINVAHDLVAN